MQYRWRVSRLRRPFALLVAVVLARFVPSFVCGRDAAGFLRGDRAAQAALAEELVAFEAADDIARVRMPNPGASPQWPPPSPFMGASPESNTVLSWRIG